MILISPEYPDPLGFSKEPVELSMAWLHVKELSR